MAGCINTAGRSVKRRDPPSDENQDSWFSGAMGDAGIIVVSDGVSSARSARATSQTIVAVIEAEWKGLIEAGLGGLTADNGPRWLEEWWGDASGGVAARLDEALRECGRKEAPGDPNALQATLALAIVAKDMLGVVWAGDSRVYLLRGGRLRCLTRDHVQVAEDEPWPWNEMHYFAVGSRSLSRWVGPGHTAYSFVTEQFQPGDIVLACSDGLWSQRYPWHWEARWSRAVLFAENPEEMIERATAGVEWGCDDDTTVALLAAWPPALCSGLPPLLESRLTALGYEEASTLSEFWSGYSVQRLGSYEATRDGMMKEMEKYDQRTAFCTGLPATFRAVEPAATGGQSGGSRGCCIEVSRTGQIQPRRLAMVDGIVRVIDRDDRNPAVKVLERADRWFLSVSGAQAVSIWRPLVRHATTAIPLEATLLLGKREVEVRGLVGPGTPEEKERTVSSADCWSSHDHCRICVLNETMAEVTDLGAENGTWVLECRLSGNCTFEIPWWPGNPGLLATWAAAEIGLRLRD